jgi:enoyl-CoA hydratase/carnithine racemase
MSETIELSQDGGIATITISNPARRNAFTPDMRRAIFTNLKALAVEPQCRAIVLTGSGDHFCAGADLSRVDPGKPRQTPLETRENMQEVHLLIAALANGPKPVIAAIEGLAVGGGFSMALACDYVVASRTAKLGAAFGKLGLIGDMGIMYGLKARLGSAKAKRMLALDTQLDGAEAHRMGLVDEVVDPGGAYQAAVQEAQRWADAAPLSVAYTKAAFSHGMTTLSDAFRAELDYLPLVIRSADFEAALAAFRAKEKPQFRGC